MNGQAITNAGVITNIQVDWGDKASSNSRFFPFVHTYSKAGLYTITVTAYIKLGILSWSVSRSVQTSELTLENSIPKGSPVIISTKANAILNLSTSTTNIQDNIPVTYKLDGSLVNRTGYPISQQSIRINIRWIEHPDLYNNNDTAKTDKSGYFSKSFDNLLLQR